MDFHDSSGATEMHFGNAWDEKGAVLGLDLRARTPDTVNGVLVQVIKRAIQRSESCVGCVSLIATVVH